MSSPKMEPTTSNFEVDFQDTHPKLRLVGMLDGARVSLTALALATAIAVLGVSADSLAVFNRTYLPAEFLLPLWPEDIDIRPTTAMVATSSIVTALLAISLLASKVSVIRNNTLGRLVGSILAPLAGFITALIAMAFFYGVDSSSTVENLQSWTCRWQDVPMRTEPQFGTLCKQSKAGLGLTVMLVPVQAIIVGLAAYQFLLERKLNTVKFTRAQKAGSPALS